MTKNRTKYTRGFKLAILAHINNGISTAQIAKQNVFHPTLIARWKREYEQNPEKAFTRSGYPYKDQAKIA